MKTRTGLSHEWGQSKAVRTLMLAAMPLVLVSSAVAQTVTEAGGQAEAVSYSAGKMFTFLFLTLGPLKLLGPFVKGTRGYDKAAKRKLALEATLIAAISVLVASTLGQNTLRKWNISIGSLMMTAGLILFLIALKPILEQFVQQEHQPPAAERPPLISPMALAFPTIVTPYGIAILILLMSLSSTSTVEVLGIAIFILLVDLITMLFADMILTTRFVAPVLGIVGVVMGVLQVALGVQAMVIALRLLGFHG
jgi:multiple antibiotic resistance protein